MKNLIQHLRIDSRSVVLFRKMLALLIRENKKDITIVGLGGAILLQAAGLNDATYDWQYGYFAFALILMIGLGVASFRKISQKAPEDFDRPDLIDATTRWLATGFFYSVLFFLLTFALLVMRVILPTPETSDTIAEAVYDKEFEAKFNSKHYLRAIDLYDNDNDEGALAELYKYFKDDPGPQLDPVTMYLELEPDTDKASDTLNKLYKKTDHPVYLVMGATLKDTKAEQLAALDAAIAKHPHFPGGYIEMIKLVGGDPEEYVDNPVYTAEERERLIAAGRKFKEAQKAGALRPMFISKDEYELVSQIYDVTVTNLLDEYDRPRVALNTEGDWGDLLPSVRVNDITNGTMRVTIDGTHYGTVKFKECPEKSREYCNDDYKRNGISLGKALAGSDVTEAKKRNQLDVYYTDKAGQEHGPFIFNENILTTARNRQMEKLKNATQSCAGLARKMNTPTHAPMTIVSIHCEDFEPALKSVKLGVDKDVPDTAYDVSKSDAGLLNNDGGGLLSGTSRVMLVKGLVKKMSYQYIYWDGTESDIGFVYMQ